MPRANQLLDLRLGRVGDPADIEIIRALFLEYQADIGIDLCFQGFAEELTNLPGPYAPPRGGLWLARADDLVVGCIALREIDGARAEMKRLFVRPAGRGRGLGRQLVGVSIEEARRVGYRTLCLDTLPTMRAAQALYAELGFHDIAPYCANPVVGARYMALDL